MIEDSAPLPATAPPVKKKRVQNVEAKRLWHLRNRERVNAVSKARYESNREAEKEKRRAYYARNKAAISASAKRHYQANRERIKVAVVRYRKEHPGCRKPKDALAARQKDRRRYPKRKAMMIAYQARYRKENSDRIKSRMQRLRKNPEFREKTNARTRAYIKTSSGRLSKLNIKHKRRAAKKATPNPATVADLRTIRAAARGCCHYCRQRRPLTFDHVIPLAKGGPHSRDNIVMACGSCNSSKGAQDPAQFAQSLGLLLV